TRDFLVWRGREHSVVTREMDHIRPNDVVVVRVDERGLQGLGQTVPGSAGFEEGLDVWERAFHQARGKAVLRLNRELWEPWKGHPAVAALFMVFDDADFDQNELHSVLQAIAGAARGSSFASDGTVSLPQWIGGL